MPIHEILKLKAAGNEEINMAIMLAMHCGPILKGSKAGSIITLSGRQLSAIKFLINGTSVSYCVLKSKGDKFILYLYREQEISEYINREDIKAFLKGYGYKGEDLRESLAVLSERILLYGNGKTQFPHEIGVFLDYPLADVRGFIENQGKNYIYSGYWKVYHNAEEAIKLFRRYDREREMAVREVVLGKTIQEVAV